MGESCEAQLQTSNIKKLSSHWEMFTHGPKLTSKDVESQSGPVAQLDRASEFGSSMPHLHPVGWIDKCL